MKKFWLVAADASRARFFEASSPNGSYTELESLENEDARKKGSELNTDGPGRMDDPSAHNGTPGKMGRSATEESGRKDQIIDEFAGEVVDKLRKAHAQGKFDQFSIVAAPEFLGRLRKKMDSTTKKALLEDIGKNVTDHDPAEIQSHLSKSFGGAGVTPTKPPMNLGARFDL